MGRKRGGEFAELTYSPEARRADHASWLESVRRLMIDDGLIAEPNYVGVRQGGDGTYTDARRERVRTRRGSAAWNHEREEDSVSHIEQLLAEISFFDGRDRARIVQDMRRTEAFSPEDRQGTDLEVVFSRSFADFCGLPCVRLQIKSSEEGVEAFATKGKKKFGSTGAEWKRICRVLLDGQWADGSIVADFLTQLMNLIDIYGDEGEMADFLSCFDGKTRESYGRAYLQIEQYRAALLEWVSARPRRENGGKTIFY